MGEVKGRCNPKFERVRELFARNIAQGDETGASLYLNIDGEEVIDLWGGWRDMERSTPWDEHTLVNVFSGCKPVTSLAVLMLVDRGLLDLEAPVARYWPEFAQNGKERVLVRHLLSHTAGLPAWETPFSHADAMDIPRSTARLAAQAPWWEPGAFASYHASTFGHLNSELVRRVAGCRLSEFIAREIARPLDADFLLGVPDAQFGRLATVYPSAEESAPAPRREITDSMTQSERINARQRAGSFAGTMGDPLTVFNSAEWRRTEFGGSSGHANARGLGRIMSALSGGGAARGVRLLSPQTIAQIFREQSHIIDPYYGRPIRWGIGYALAPLAPDPRGRGPVPFIQPGPRTCYWYGTGGSLALADVERRIAIGYAMNQCRSGRNMLNGVYYKAIHECL